MSSAPDSLESDLRSQATLSITILPNSSSFDSLEPGLMPLEYGGAAVGFLRQRDAGPGRTNGIEYPMALRISSSTEGRSLVHVEGRRVSGIRRLHGGFRPPKFGPDRAIGCQ